MNHKRITLIPLLVLVYYFVHYTTDLYYFIEPKRALLQFVQYVLVTGLLFFTARRLFTNKEQYTLAFTTVLFLFLFFGSLIDTAVSVHLLQEQAGVGFRTIACFFAAAGLVIFICGRLSRFVTQKMLQFWITWCVLLLLYDTVSFFVVEKAEKKYLHTAKHLKPFTTNDKPGVFFLLLDMYPSDSVLSKYLGHQNIAMNSFLKERGFFVSGNARSLYGETYYSLASTLSLQSLPYVDDPAVKAYKKPLIALKNIQASSLPKIFENSGYTFRNYSVFDFPGQPSPLRFNLNYHLRNALTGTTFFNRFYDTFEPDFFQASRGIDAGFIKRSWSNNVKDDLQWLEKKFAAMPGGMPASSQPAFNYFHLVMPHPPILYDSSGKEYAIKDRYAYNGFVKTNENFISYLEYANRSVKKMVDAILKQSGGDAIIILQGDHGYREFQDRFPDVVRYGIFNAVYLPKQHYQNFHDSMTPVYTFRQILKNEFAADVE
jgi:hypothetical protein